VITSQGFSLSHFFCSGYFTLGQANQEATGIQGHKNKLFSSRAQAVLKDQGSISSTFFLQLLKKVSWFLTQDLVLYVSSDE